MTWKLKIWTGANSTTVDTGLFDYQSAVDYTERLYPGSYVIGQTFAEEEPENDGGGLLSWLFR